MVTVLFSDIVRSTERAAELGDARRTELLDRHHRAVRSQLQLYKGIEVNTTGDGFLSTFESPGQASRPPGRSGLPFADRGRRALRGVQGEWQIYALADTSRS